MNDVTKPWADPDTIRSLLADCHTWAVVGLGDNPDRAAYGVAHFLQQHGKRIVPVHPSAASVHGEPGYEKLTDIPFYVDCVDVFRNSDVAGEFVDEALQVGAKAVWFQLDVVDHSAFDRAQQGGLAMVMDRCPAIEWSRYGPSG